MTTIQLTPDEVQLTRAALRAFLDDFGHEEMDVVRRVQDAVDRRRGIT